MTTPARSIPVPPPGARVVGRRRSAPRHLVGVVLVGLLVAAPFASAAADEVGPAVPSPASPAAPVATLEPSAASSPPPLPMLPVVPSMAPSGPPSASATPRPPTARLSAAHQEVAAATTVPTAPVAFATAPEAASRYQEQVTCDPVEKPGAVRLRALLRATYGRGTTAGITRACSVGGNSHHKEGRAYDWGLNAYDPADHAIADQLLGWLLGPDAGGHVAGNARRLGVQYVIWDREIWNASSGWKPYNGASPHTDHIHLSLSWDGAWARTSFWTGTSVTRVDHGPCQVYVGVLVAPYQAPNYSPCPAPVRPPTNPTGRVDTFRPVLGGVGLSGWTKDADTSSPLDVHAYIDGVGAGAFRANLARADVGGSYGFDVLLPLAAGSHEVCLYAINVGPGTTNPLLGCRTVSRPSGDPVGNFEGVSLWPGGVRPTGWTIDPDTTAPLGVHVYVGGRYAGSAGASGSRSDLGAAFPFMGSDHAFDTVVPAAAGRQDVCVFAINAGPGASNPLLGCRKVSALGNNPVGNLEAVTGGRGSLAVSGWTLDPDVADSGQVHTYVDGVYRGSLPTSSSRPDVRSYYPGWTDGRGFAGTVTGLFPGRRSVCVYAINRGPGDTNTLLRCAEVSVS